MGFLEGVEQPDIQRLGTIYSGREAQFSQTLYARMTTLSGHSFSRLLDFLDCCTFLGSFFLINNLI